MALYSEGIKDLLVAEGFLFDGSSDWSVIIGRKPVEPARCIVIYDAGGKDPNPRWLIDYPNIQIRIRGDVNDYQAAFNKAKEIKSILLGVPSQTLNGDRWNHINMLGDIALMGYDENNRPEFSMNFTLIIEPAQVASDSREPL